MSSIEYYRQYNASPAGKARTARNAMTPKRKIYRSDWQDKNREKVKAYGRAYYVSHPKPHVAVVVGCQAYNCTGTFIRGHGRKFCEDCRIAFGHHIKSRWWYRRKARLAA